VDFSTMSDEDVLTLRNQVNIEADRRLAAMSLLNDTRDLALKAKDLGRTKEEVEQIVGSVVTDVFAPEPDPSSDVAPDATPVDEPVPAE
jgi:hypothetical protein